MKLGYVILADAAEIGANGKVSMLGGEFETIFVPQLPTVHTRLSLVVKLLVDATEWDNERTLRIVLTDPSGEMPSPQLETQFAPKRPQGQSGGVGKFLVVANLPAILLLNEGEHVLHLLVDDEELGAVTLRVLLLSPTSQADGDGDVGRVSRG